MKLDFDTLKQNYLKHLEYRKEYYKKNTDKFKEAQKKFKEKDIDEFRIVNKNYQLKYYNENLRDKITCECGKTVRRGSKNAHLKTKIHKKFIDSKN